MSVLPSLDVHRAAAPGLLRRIAIMTYDALLLIAVLLVAAALVVVPLGVGFGIAVQGSSLWFRAYLTLVTMTFFCGFWIRGGQTLGMRAWRVRVVRNDGSALGVTQALVRWFSALLSWAAFGLGFLWILVDRERLAWHDRLSRTRLVLLENPGRVGLGRAARFAAYTKSPATDRAHRADRQLTGD